MAAREKDISTSSTMAATADKHELYEEAVQNVEEEVRFFIDTKRLSLWSRLALRTQHQSRLVRRPSPSSCFLARSGRSGPTILPESSIGTRRSAEAAAAAAAFQQECHGRWRSSIDD